MDEKRLEPLLRRQALRGLQEGALLLLGKLRFHGGILARAEPVPILRA